MTIRDILITGKRAVLPGAMNHSLAPRPIAPASPHANHVLTYVIPGAAIGKPRMTQRDKWKKRPCVVRYREWADRVRAIVGEVPPAESVVSLSWTAYFEPPKSRSKKQRAAAIAKIGELHRAKPDRDNVDKAVLDILWPKRDSAIADGRISKRWDWEARLEIRIEIGWNGCYQERTKYEHSRQV